MKILPTLCRQFGLVGLGLLLLTQPCLLSAQSRASDPNPANSEQTTYMDPYSVSALFSAIEVRFTLSGKNLFKPTEDTVESAQVVKIDKREEDVEPLIQPGDQLISLDGVALQGRTLREIANQLMRSRAAGMPIWKIRRGLQSMTVKFDGDWLIPLPGLNR